MSKYADVICMARSMYWLRGVLASGAVAIRAGNFIRTALGVAVFSLFAACASTTPASGPDETYVKEAWAYFKNKCATEAGEKIYKTYTGVKSVLVVKPLPPATEKDLYDQFWYGDPYSNATPWDGRAQLAASILADPLAPTISNKMERGFDYVETFIPFDSSKIFKFYYPPGGRKSVREPVNSPTSRFGVAWEDISTPDDRKYWIAGSRLRVIDLIDNSVIAERIGFLIEAGFGATTGQRRPWLTSRGAKTTCPSIKEGHYDDRWFILKALSPFAGKRNGE